MNLLKKLDCVIRRIMSFCYAYFDKDYTEEKHNAFIQFIKFCFVGASNVILYYFTYVFCLHTLRKYLLFSKADYIVAQIAGFLISVFWTYTINRKYVFSDSNDSYFVSLITFYITYSFTGLIMNPLLLYLWKRVGISEYIAPLINVIFNTPVNYFISKVWTFRSKKADDV